MGPGKTPGLFCCMHIVDPPMTLIGRHAKRHPAILISIVISDSVLPRADVDRNPSVTIFCAISIAYALSPFGLAQKPGIQLNEHILK